MRPCLGKKLLRDMSIPKVQHTEPSNIADPVQVAPHNKKSSIKRNARYASLLTPELQQRLQRRRGSRRIVAMLLMASDLVSCSLAFAFANLVYLNNFNWMQGVNLLAVCLPMFLLFSINSNSHNAIYIQRLWSGVAKAILALAFAGACLLLALFFLKIGAEYSRGMILIAGLTCLVTLPGGRSLVALLVRSRVRDGLYAHICIFDGVPVVPVRGVVSISADVHQLSPCLNSAEMISRLGELAKGLDRITVYSTSENRTKWAAVLKAMDIPCEIVLPELNNYSALAISRFAGDSSLILTTGTLKWNQAFIKRTFDILSSAIAIFALSPLFLVIALAIKFDSPGPVLFRQERIGLGNRRFMIFKFRSMRTDMADFSASRLTEKDDPRVTKIGSFIRRTSIDELPQLFNVLLGDMSMVGPRPHAEKATAGQLLYWEVDNAYWHRHVVKPGITGLAQIRGHRGNTFHEGDLQKRLDSDLFYVENWSFFEDIRILLKTFSVISHDNAF